MFSKFGEVIVKNNLRLLGRRKSMSENPYSGKKSHRIEGANYYDEFQKIKERQRKAWKRDFAIVLIAIVMITFIVMFMIY